MLRLISKYKAPAIIIACSIALSGAITYGLLSQDKPAAAKITVTTTTDSEYIDRTLDAMLRSYIIDHVCYDEANKVYFYRIADHPHIEDMMDQGWYLSPRTKFLKLANNTYVVTEDAPGLATTPDTNGLHCKSQTVDPNWFRERK